MGVTGITEIASRKDYSNYLVKYSEPEDLLSDEADLCI